MAEGVGSGLVWDRSAATSPLGLGCQPSNLSSCTQLCHHGEADTPCRSVCRECALDQSTYDLMSYIVGFKYWWEASCILFIITGGEYGERHAASSA